MLRARETRRATRVASWTCVELAAYERVPRGVVSYLHLYILPNGENQRNGYLPARRGRADVSASSRAGTRGVRRACVSICVNTIQVKYVFEWEWQTREGCDCGDKLECRGMTMTMTMTTDVDR